MALINWTPYRFGNPFEEPEDIGDYIDYVFSEAWGQYPAPRKVMGAGKWSPPVDIHEDPENIVVKAELPGLTKKDVSIEVKNNILTISGRRTQEDPREDTNYHRIERAFGSFCRSFMLPDSVGEENITATVKDGILEITLPKARKKQPEIVSAMVEKTP
ncbi:MAG: Hsp20/alpha crystallin family protein [Deltaproteobacteria bacterium]|nr:Hsp20/alpha crystallin family protein [Deltaproteobacteria bacterium]